MIVYKFRPDMVYIEPVEVSGPAIPQYHTFTAPPNIPDGYYAQMSPTGWKLIEGIAPEYPPKPPEPTPEEIRQGIIINVQNRLDDFGKTRGYDGTVSIGKYVNISDTEISNLPEPEKTLVGKFKVECQYYSLMTAITWATCYKILNEVTDGLRVQPNSYQDIEAELPTLEWPI